MGKGVTIIEVAKRGLYVGVLSIRGIYRGINSCEILIKSYIELLDLRNARRSLDVNARIRTLSTITILIGTLPDPQLHRMISRLTVPLEELRVSTKNCQLAKQRPVRGAELDPTRRKFEVRMWHSIWAGSAAETRRIRSIPNATKRVPYEFIHFAPLLLAQRALIDDP